MNGENIFNNGEVLSEVKTSAWYPRWIIDFLICNQIYDTSFSKYGTVYKKI